MFSKVYLSGEIRMCNVVKTLLAVVFAVTVDFTRFVLKLFLTGGFNLQTPFGIYSTNHFCCFIQSSFFFCISQNWVNLSLKYAN